MPEKPMNLRDVLAFLLDEVECLRASQVAITQFSSVHPHPDAVQLAKGQALKETHEHYDKVRRQIAGLAL